MPDLTINLWTLILGAVCGAAAVFGARRGNRLLLGAVIGAATATILTFARGYL